MLYYKASIKNALEFIESSSDPYIKMTMAHKLDPFLIGAYIKTINLNLRRESGNVLPNGNWRIYSSRLGNTFGLSKRIT